MRSDVLVAAFMFAAFGLLAGVTLGRRGISTASPRQALGFASRRTPSSACYLARRDRPSLAKMLVLPNGYRDAVGFLRTVASLRAIWGRLSGRVRADVGLVVARRSFRNRHDSAASASQRREPHRPAALVFGFVSLFFYAPRGAGVAGIEHPPAPVASGDVNFGPA